MPLCVFRLSFRTATIPFRESYFQRNTRTGKRNSFSQKASCIHLHPRDFPQRRQSKIITEGYLNIDVGDGVYIPKVYLRGAAKADSSERSRFLKQLSEGITASGRLYGGGSNDDGSTSVDEISVVSKHNLPVREALTSVRSSIVRHIGRIFGTDAGIVSALIVGDKTALQSDRTEAYRATGTAHLLAISGFHTGIIAAILGLFVPKRKRWLRTAFVGIGLIMYCCIAVYAAGIVRASIMVICALLCRALNRRADSLNGLAAAAVLILAFEPFQLYSVGFQLSFAACFGLILFSKQFETALASAHIPLAGSVSACLGASIATAPFQAAYFGCLPLYFVAGNLIAVPLFSLVMVLCIAILIIGIPFPGLRQCLPLRRVRCSLLLNAASAFFPHCRMLRWIFRRFLSQAALSSLQCCLCFPRMCCVRFKKGRDLPYSACCCLQALWFLV